MRGALLSLKKTCFYVSYLPFLQNPLHTFSATIKNTENKYVSASQVTEKLDLLSCLFVCLFVFLALQPIGVVFFTAR
jgi:hypothetical protein